MRWFLLTPAFLLMFAAGLTDAGLCACLGLAFASTYFAGRIDAA